jgi:hypothetical protein
MQDQTDWKKFWQEGRTPWDLGCQHPATRYVLAEISKSIGYEFSDKMVVIPGAGRAHDAMIFLQKKAFVRAVDLSDIAVKEAEENFKSKRRFSATARDYFQLAQEDSEGADVIFDRAMLCALPEGLRKKYAESVESHLKQGGLFISLPFRRFKEEISGPPFEVSEVEMTGLFEKNFNLVLAERSKFESGISLIEEEYIYVFRKK